VAETVLQNQPLVAASTRRAINLRSILLGLLGIVFVCGLTPYSDYALNNTPLVGNNLPLGLTVATLLFALLINAPLLRWAPRRAFTSGEIAVAFTMTLMSCALPSRGLMAFFVPSLLAPFYNGDPENRAAFAAMNLPDWLWPTFDTASYSERSRSLVVGGYVSHIGEHEIPWSAWITPALTWGVFILSFFGALVCLMTLVRRQWMENERLGFPLAQVQLALIEQPEPGRRLNALFRSRSFWIAIGIVFALRLLNGAATYWPKYVPGISLGFNFTAIFTEEPFVFMSRSVMAASIYIIIVGITFFIPTSIAFSMCAFVILNEILRMAVGVTGGEPARPMARYEHMGAVLAFGLTALWIGRGHWKMVLAQAFRGRRQGEPTDPYVSYPVTFWIFVACLAAMVGWLVLAGCQLLPAITIVLLVVFLFFIIARVIAETGLVYGQLLFPVYAPWQLASIYGIHQPVTLETFFHSAMMQVKFYDFREPVTVYASHSLKISDETGLVSPDQPRSTGRALVGLLVLSLVVGYFVSFASTLATEYTYAATLDESETTPINRWSVVDATRMYEMGPSAQYKRGVYQVAGNDSPLGHMAGGFVITTLLGLAKLRLSWWPLHPVGYLLTNTTPGQLMWFSILIGWACKVVCLRIGGATAYRAAKPFFLGLVVGDSLAAGVAVIISIVLSSLGITYKAMNFMPP
jgi:hypothetical protein